MYMCTCACMSVSVCMSVYTFMHTIYTFIHLICLLSYVNTHKYLHIHLYFDEIPPLIFCQTSQRDTFDIQREKRSADCSM